MTQLTLEIITPDGRTYRADGLDRVVFRRREREHEQGSEVAIFPGHGPLLTRVPSTAVRFIRDGVIWHLAVAGGFVEVKDSRILVVTPRFAECGQGTEARVQAQRLADEWLAESPDFLREMTGFALPSVSAARD